MPYQYHIPGEAASDAAGGFCYIAIEDARVLSRLERAITGNQLGKDGFTSKQECRIPGGSMLIGFRHGKGKFNRLSPGESVASLKTTVEVLFTGECGIGGWCGPQVAQKHEVL